MSEILNHEDGGPRDAPALLLAGSLGTTLRMWDPQADAAAIKAPTLVVGGAQDAAIPPEHQERLAASIDGARLEILADHLDRKRATA